MSHPGSGTWTTSTWNHEVDVAGNPRLYAGGSGRWHSPQTANLTPYQYGGQVYGQVYGFDDRVDAQIIYPLELEPDYKIEAYISEFTGTFFLVLTIGFNVLQNTALAPISIGAMLMAMIFATGKVSGGHFNPAVTLGVYCRGKIDGDKAIGYIAVQMAGGMVAGCAYLAILGATFSVGPGVGHGLASVILAEVLFTAALVFVVLSVATTEQDKDNWYFGLAIGFTVMAAAFAIGPISGCSLNPAVTFGVIFSNFIHTGFLRISLLLVYTLAPIVGSFIAVLLFHVVREAEYTADHKIRAELPTVISPPRSPPQSAYTISRVPASPPAASRGLGIP